MFGGTGGDRLAQGVGNNIMLGGIGDDTYVVNSTGDVLMENGGGTYIFNIFCDPHFCDNLNRLEHLEFTNGSYWDAPISLFPPPQQPTNHFMC
ncbi:MAG: hypothetical protein V2B20_14120 [Pseudomonadota bacterium]